MFKYHTCLGLAAGFAMTACSVVPTQSSQYAQYEAPIQAQPVNTPYDNARTGTVYESAAAYSATPASFGGPVSCPIGTTPYSNGTCLLDDPNASLQSATFTGVPTPTPSYQQVQPVTPAPRLTRAATPRVAPSTYTGTDITRSYGGANYRVQSGDTVYSLARKLCVPVSAIQSSNGLDANFGIQIGQGLQLPASQC